MKELQYINHRWGFIRETENMAIKLGVDVITGLPYTPLSQYLDEAIFPELRGRWEANKCPPFVREAFAQNRSDTDDSKGIVKRIRPDYFYEEEKIIIEFYGVGHYKSTAKTEGLYATSGKISRMDYDEERETFFREKGYTLYVVPYFIQLTKESVKNIFNISCSEDLFPNEVPSFRVSSGNTPGFLPEKGLKKMVKEFQKYAPSQYEPNLNYLKEYDKLLEKRFPQNADIYKELITGTERFEKAWNELKS